MITGSPYVLRGGPVRVLAAWTGRANPDLPRLQARLPLVRTGKTAPRNVLIEHPDGSLEVRPFRGLRRVRGGEDA